MPGPSIKNWLIEAGFEDVQETIEAAPIGLWPKDKRYVGFSPLFPDVCFLFKRIKTVVLGEAES